MLCCLLPCGGTACGCDLSADHILAGRHPLKNRHTLAETSDAHKPVVSSPSFRELSSRSPLCFDLWCFVFPLFCFSWGKFLSSWHFLIPHGRPQVFSVWVVLCVCVFFIFYFFFFFFSWSFQLSVFPTGEDPTCSFMCSRELMALPVALPAQTTNCKVQCSTSPYLFPYSLLL